MPIQPIGGQSSGVYGTGVVRVPSGDGSYTLVPQSMHGDPSLYENSISKTVAAPGQTFAPNLGTWAPPTPEYLTAPGYETYAPTAAYGYSPTGGDWSGAYPGYGGGGGGGGLTSGDFGGGADNSTLGGLLSAASLLGGANDLSSFLTGSSLLEHAGIQNPFSGLLGGGEGLNLQALNPYSNTPLTALFGEAGRNLGLAPSAFPNALPGGVGGSVGIGPSGYLSPDALAGVSNAVPPGSPSLLPFDPSGGMALPSVPPPGGTAPLTDVFGPYELPRQAVDLSLPAEAWNPTTGEFNFVQAGEPATGQFTTAAGLSNIQGGAGLSTGLPSSAAEIAAGQAAEFGAGGFFGSGSGGAAQLGTALANAGLTAAAGAMPGLAAGIPFAGVGAPSLFGAGTAAAGTAAAGAGAGAGAGLGLAALGPAAMIALPFLARALLDKPTDPTINARLTHQLEGTAQAKGIKGLEEAIYENPNLYDLGRIATSGRTGGHGRVQLAPPGTKPTNGGIAVIPWSSELSDLFNKNIDSLQAASNAGQQATSAGPDDIDPNKYHPIYKPDPNTYKMVAGDYGVMEPRLVGGPAFDAYMEDGPG